MDNCVRFSVGTGNCGAKAPSGEQAWLCFGNRGPKSHCVWALVSKGERGRNEGQEVSRDQVTEAEVGFSSGGWKPLGCFKQGSDKFWVHGSLPTL